MLALTDELNDVLVDMVCEDSSVDNDVKEDRGKMEGVETRENDPIEDAETPGLKERECPGDFDSRSVRLSSGDDVPVSPAVAVNSAENVARVERVEVATPDVDVEADVDGETLREDFRVVVCDGVVHEDEVGVEVCNVLADGVTDIDTVAYTVTVADIDTEPEAIAVGESFDVALLVAGGLCVDVKDITTVGVSRGV